MNHDALMMEFRDEAAARMAADTFEELGYDPALHDAGRLHIHVVSEDLTSALEIMQSFGGKILERAPTDMETLTQSAYCLDAIPIPAHTVNEDWVDAYRAEEPAAGADGGLFPEEDASYDRFEAT